MKRFLTIASHDLQSPLRHIAMYAEILLDDLSTASRRATVLRAALPVMGDATLLVQLLQNLVSNAIHYCDEDSSEVRIPAENDGARWRISVSDNGPGINPEYRELVFQAFKRLVGRNVEGTGLGLAICKRIAQLHGGAIWCEDGRARGRRSSWNCRLRGPRRWTCLTASNRNSGPTSVRSDLGARRKSCSSRTAPPTYRSRSS
jgi:signal transduction histidine kinase